MKGRTYSSVVTRSNEWHQQMTKIKNHQYVTWQGSGIPKYEKESEKYSVKIVEITNSRDLINEGRYMKHCVGGYSKECVNARTFIFRMELITIEKTERFTLQLHSDLRLGQCKGKMNVRLHPLAEMCVNDWYLNARALRYV